MIRDPSDGSVREPKEIKPQASEINGVQVKVASEEITSSGLAPDLSNRAERLKTSREWLKDYHERKGK